MLQRFRRLRDDDSGFTLTELLITVIILGILAGIVVFAVVNFTGEGKTSACKADRRAIEVAVEAYRAKGGTPPPGGDDTARLNALKNASFIKETPNNVDYVVHVDNSGAVTMAGPGGTGAAPC